MMDKKTKLEALRFVEEIDADRRAIERVESTDLLGVVVQILIDVKWQDQPMELQAWRPCFGDSKYPTRSEILYALIKEAEAIKNT